MRRRRCATSPSRSRRCSASTTPPTVESRADLPDGPIDGVVIANELLDNLPFRLCVFDGAWREAYVAIGGDGTFGEELSAPFDPPPAVLPPSPPHGSRAPLHDAAVAWVAAARARLRRGRVLAFDYGRSTTAALAMRPWREWLRTYRGHRRGDHYLAGPGTQDITAEVAFDQFPVADTVATQAQFLQRWGIDELVAVGDREWAAKAGAPDLAAVAMRSRGVEAQALLDPAGLGAFVAAEWSGTVDGR